MYVCNMNLVHWTKNHWTKKKGNNGTNYTLQYFRKPSSSLKERLSVQRINTLNTVTFRYSNIFNSLCVFFTFKISRRNHVTQNLVIPYKYKARYYRYAYTAFLMVKTATFHIFITFNMLFTTDCKVLIKKGTLHVLALSVHLVTKCYAL